MRDASAPSMHVRAIAIAVALGCCAAPTGREPVGPAMTVARSVDETLGSITLHTERLGAADAPVVIVLHDGPGLDSATLRPWLDPISETHRLVYVDLRGHGRSSDPPEGNGYTLADLVGDVVHLADKLSPARPVALVAHGIGAAVALEFAARHPDRVARLALVAPLTDGVQLRTRDDRIRRAVSPEALATYRSLATPQGTLRDARDVGAALALLKGVWTARAVAAESFARVVYRPEAAENVSIALGGWNAARLASLVRAPTLVIAGERDVLVTPGEVLALADALPHARTLVVPGAAHCPFVDDSARTLGALRAFLALP